MRNLENFIAKLESGSISGESELHMRNEDIQSGTRSKVYPRLKRESGKMCKLLIPKEIALDFDPFTGEETEKYNRSNKFRPVASPTSLAQALKKIANNNAKTKERLMAESGVATWDTTTTELTEEDKRIFAPYLQIQIFTLPTISCKLKQITGRSEIPRNYVIHVDRDSITGRIKGEVPLPIEANRFFSAVAREEIADLQDKIDKKEIILNEKQQKEKISEIYDKRILVSSDRSANFVRVLELKTDNSFSTNNCVDFSSVTVESLGKMMRLSRLTSELSTSLEKFKSGAYAASDHYFDYYELDMTCPADKSTPMEIGKDTRYERPFKPIKDEANFAKFSTVFCNLLDDGENLEKIVWASTGIREYTEDDNRRFLAALEAEIDLDDKFVTKNVLTAYQNFITMVFPDTADVAIESANAGLSDKKDGVNHDDDDEYSKGLMDLTEFNTEELDEVLD